MESRPRTGDPDPDDPRGSGGNPAKVLMALIDDDELARTAYVSLLLENLHRNLRGTRSLLRRAERSRATWLETRTSF